MTPVEPDVREADPAEVEVQELDVLELPDLALLVDISYDD